MSPEWWLLAKIIVSVTMVLGLTLTAEHVSPKAAGILSGYPLGVAIALFFIGVENGNDFAAAGAVYTLAGFSGSLALVYSYFFVSRRGHGIYMASIISILTFLLAVSLLRGITFNLATATALTVTVIALSIYLCRRIENIQVQKRVQLTLRVLLIRAFAATGCVLLITGIADQVGERWAGVLSAFPITLFPFMVILHFTYGKNHVYTVIKNFPVGMGSLVVYVTIVALAYPTSGIGWGTALAFSGATVYLLCLTYFVRWRNATKVPIAHT